MCRWTFPPCKADVFVFASLQMYKTKTSPEWGGEKMIRTFGDFIKQNKSGLSKQGISWERKINLFTLLVEKLASQRDSACTNNLDFHQGKFSHWMINRNPGERQQRSSLSPFPSKFVSSVFWKSALGDLNALYTAYCSVINPSYVIQTEKGRAPIPALSCFSSH